MKNSHFWLALTASLLFAGGGGALCWLEYGLSWRFGAYFIALLLGLLTAPPLHEFGHFLFGLFVKVKAMPDGGIFTFKSSSCLIIPKTDEGLKKRIIITTLGGVAVNLIVVILGVVFAFAPSLPTWMCGIMPGTFYIFLFNVLPSYTESGKTDGMVIAEILGDEDSAKVMLSVLTVQAQVLGGKPIEEVDKKLLFNLPQIPEDDINFIALTALRRDYCEATGDIANATKYSLRFKELQKYLEE